MKSSFAIADSTDINPICNQRVGTGEIVLARGFDESLSNRALRTLTDATSTRTFDWSCGLPAFLFTYWRSQYLARIHASFVALESIYVQPKPAIHIQEKHAPAIPFVGVCRFLHPCGHAGLIDLVGEAVAANPQELIHLGLEHVKRQRAHLGYVHTKRPDQRRSDAGEECIITDGHHCIRYRSRCQS